MNGEFSLNWELLNLKSFQVEEGCFFDLNESVGKVSVYGFSF